MVFLCESVGAVTPASAQLLGHGAEVGLLAAPEAGQRGVGGAVDQAVLRPGPRDGGGGGEVDGRAGARHQNPQLGGVSAMTRLVISVRCVAIFVCTCTSYYMTLS